MDIDGELNNLYLYSVKMDGLVQHTFVRLFLSLSLSQTWPYG